MSPEEHAVDAVRAHGRREFERGFLVGIRAAWTILRWATAGKPEVPRKDLATWARNRIAEAHREAGMEMPEEGKGP